MNLSSLRPAAIARYRDIAWIAMKHGGPELMDRLGIAGAFRSGHEEDDTAAEASELASDLEELGPTFVKLGQLLSSRADLLPMEYLHALSRLQDNVDTFPPEDVEEIFQKELGKTPGEAYAEFGREPLAAASLGQVHLAKLHDGTKVAVKVQRPQAQEQMEDDLAALEQIAKVIDATTEIGRRYRFTQIVRELRKSLEEELDYEREAQHLETLRSNLSQYNELLIPKPYHELTSTRVLTMQFIDGEKITALSDERTQQMDGSSLVDQVIKAYMQQILEDGFFHADPHPGNVLVTPDGRVALLDLGMVGYTRQNMRDDLLRLIMAVSEGKADDASRVGQHIGEETSDFQHRLFRAGIGDALVKNHSGKIADMQLGRLLLEVCRVAGNTGLRLPPEVMLLGKTLMNLDEIGRRLAPDLDTNQVFRRHAVTIVQHRLVDSLRPGQVFAEVLEFKAFIEDLPERLNRLMDVVADNEFELKVDAVDENRLISGIEKIANRVTVGLVLAALIIGASLMMNVENESTYTIFGYPILSMLCFLAAAMIGFFLVVDFVWDEIKQKSKARKNR